MNCPYHDTDTEGANCACDEQTQKFCATLHAYQKLAWDRATVEAHRLREQEKKTARATLWLVIVTAWIWGRNTADLILILNAS